MIYTKYDVEAVVALYAATHEVATLMAKGATSFPRRSAKEAALIMRGREIADCTKLIALRIGEHPNALQAVRQLCDSEILVINDCVYGLKHQS